MLSRPNCEVHVTNLMKIRRLDDLFAIDGITMFEEDNDSDSCYAVAGGILDASYLYDLMMTLLEDG